MVEKVVSHGLWLERNFPNPELRIEQKDMGEETVERRASLPSSCDSRLPLVLGFLESVSKVTQGVTPQLCAENFWTSVMRFPAALLLVVHEIDLEVSATKRVLLDAFQDVRRSLVCLMFRNVWGHLDATFWARATDLLLKRISPDVVGGERFFPQSRCSMWCHFRRDPSWQAQLHFLQRPISRLWRLELSALRRIAKWSTAPNKRCPSNVYGRLRLCPTAFVDRLRMWTDNVIEKSVRRPFRRLQMYVPIAFHESLSTPISQKATHDPHAQKHDLWIITKESSTSISH